MDADVRRRINHALSVKMKDMVRMRRCPNCHRKGGLIRYPVGGLILWKCQFCGFEKGKLR